MGAMLLSPVGVLLCVCMGTFFYGAAIYKLHQSASIRYELARYDGDMTRFAESDKAYDNEIKTGILLNLQF